MTLLLVLGSIGISSGVIVLLPSACTAAVTVSHRTLGFCVTVIQDVATRGRTSNAAADRTDEPARLQAVLIRSLWFQRSQSSADRSHRSCHLSFRESRIPRGAMAWLRLLSQIGGISSPKGEQFTGDIVGRKLTVPFVLKG